MAKRAQPIIHIGGPKTASTTLQRAFLTPHPKVLYFGEDGDGCNLEESKALYSQILYDDAFYQKDKCKAIFEQRLSLARENNQQLIYSNVDICSSPIPTLCAQRLKVLLPDAKIMMVVRNQLDSLVSFYVNHGSRLRNVPQSYFRKYVSIEDWLKHCEMMHPLSDFSHFLFYTHLKPYIDLFGKENIVLLRFEDYIHNRDSFTQTLGEIFSMDKDEIASYLGNKNERKRRSKSEFYIHNIIYSFPYVMRKYCGHDKLAKAARSLSGLMGFKKSYSEIELPTQWKVKLSEIYSVENRKLEELFSLSLDEYSYPLSKN